MAERQWTPGPWEVKPDNDGENSFIGPVIEDKSSNAFPRNWVACVCEGFAKEEWTSNAHLIAAAPDLYDALDAILKYGYDHSQDLVHAALSKARGERNV